MQENCTSTTFYISLFQKNSCVKYYLLIMARFFIINELLLLITNQTTKGTTLIVRAAFLRYISKFSYKTYSFCHFLKVSSISY